MSISCSGCCLYFLRLCERIHQLHDRNNNHECLVLYKRSQWDSITGLSSFYILIVIPILISLILLHSIVYIFYKSPCIRNKHKHILKYTKCITFIYFYVLKFSLCYYYYFCTRTTDEMLFIYYKYVLYPSNRIRYIPSCSLILLKRA